MAGMIRQSHVRRWHRRWQVTSTCVVADVCFVTNQATTFLSFCHSDAKVTAFIRASFTTTRSFTTVTETWSKLSVFLQDRTVMHDAMWRRTWCHDVVRNDVLTPDVVHDIMTSYKASWRCVWQRIFYFLRERTEREASMMHLCTKAKTNKIAF